LFGHNNNSIQFLFICMLTQQVMAFSLFTFVHPHVTSSL
jgi:hypothetical protein